MMRQRLLAKLLHYANAGHPAFRSEFYALKERLLRKYGTFRGHDLQEIKKECYGESVGYYEWAGCKGTKCRRCGGTGVFDIRWVRLERWEWRGYVFHRPVDDTRIPPAVGSVKIFGRIEHADYGLKSAEAVLWLYVLCGEFRLWARSLRASRYCRPRFWPMLRLQAVVMPLAMWMSWRRCWCGRRYPTWGSGWQICKKCRNNEPCELPF